MTDLVTAPFVEIILFGIACFALGGCLIYLFTKDN